MAYPGARTLRDGGAATHSAMIATGQRAKKLRTWSSARTNARFQLRRLSPAKKSVIQSADQFREVKRRKAHWKSAIATAPTPAATTRGLLASSPMASL